MHIVFNALPTVFSIVLFSFRSVDKNKIKKVMSFDRKVPFANG